MKVVALEDMNGFSKGKIYNFVMALSGDNQTVLIDNEGKLRAFPLDYIFTNFSVLTERPSFEEEPN